VLTLTKKSESKFPDGPETKTTSGSEAAAEVDGEDKNDNSIDPCDMQLLRHTCLNARLAYQITQEEPPQKKQKTNGKENASEHHVHFSESPPFEIDPEETRTTIGQFASLVTTHVVASLKSRKEVQPGQPKISAAEQRRRQLHLMDKRGGYALPKSELSGKLGTYRKEHKDPVHKDPVPVRKEKQLAAEVSPTFKSGGKLDLRKTK